MRPERAAWHPPGTLYPLALRTIGWKRRTAHHPPSAEGRGGEIHLTDPTPVPGAVAFTVGMKPISGFELAVAADRQSAARTLAGETRSELLTVPENSALRRAHVRLRSAVDPRRRPR